MFICRQGLQGYRGGSGFRRSVTLRDRIDPCWGRVPPEAVGSHHSLRLRAHLGKPQPHLQVCRIQPDQEVQILERRYEDLDLVFQTLCSIDGIQAFFGRFSATVTNSSCEFFKKILEFFRKFLEFF